MNKVIPCVFSAIPIIATRLGFFGTNNVVFENSDKVTFSGVENKDYKLFNIVSYFTDYNSGKAEPPCFKTTTVYFRPVKTYTITHSSLK
jgi:hypothetical protein